MMAEFDIIGPPRTAEITFSLEPAYNVLVSLSLLGLAENFSGLSGWVYRTVESSSPERLRANEIVLVDAMTYLGDVAWDSFPAWLDDLAARDATAMRDQALQARLTKASQVLDEIPEPAELLADRAAFLSFIEESIRSRGKGTFDPSMWEEMHALLNDPAALQDLIVTHLRTMWDETLAAEWERNLTLLEDSVAAFESLDLTDLTAVDALSRVAMRANLHSENLSWMDAIEHLILIPSVHTGPYVLRLGGLDGVTERIAFGARIPEGASVPASALSRSELLMRLNALADDTRLRVVELLAQEGELSTPDIIERLGFSQSAASRHLEHLTATGYLTMRRHQNTKLYRLTPDRLDHTFEALKKLWR
jgi:ArsR family transcriptional regulator